MRSASPLAPAELRGNRLWMRNYTISLRSWYNTQKTAFAGEGGAVCMPNIIEITDFHAPELDPYARLTQNQLRNRLEPEKGIFIA